MVKPDISRMMQEISQKHYFPSIQDHVRKWVKKSHVCDEDKQIDNSKITPEIIIIPDRDLSPKDKMHLDLLPEPSGRYKNIITALEIFSGCAFLCKVSNPTAANTAKVIIEIYDKTCALTYCNDNAQKLSFRLQHNKRNS